VSSIAIYPKLEHCNEKEESFWNQNDYAAIYVEIVL
jgi:hypothetical protein